MLDLRLSIFKTSHHKEPQVTRSRAAIVAKPSTRVALKGWVLKEIWSNRGVFIPFPPLICVDVLILTRYFLPRVTGKGDSSQQLQAGETSHCWPRFIPVLCLRPQPIKPVCAVERVSHFFHWRSLL